MFRSHRIAPLAAIVALAFAPSLAAPLAAQEWSGRGRLNGVVSDESGEPIAGAAIRLRHEKIPDSGPDDMKTDKKGRWSKLGLLGGAWTILVAAEGYAPSQGTVTVNEFQPNSPIVLELRKATSADVGDDPKLKEAQAAIDKGDAFFNNRDAASARAEYEQALALLGAPEQAGNRLRIRLKIGSTYMAEGKNAEAVEVFKTVLAEEPTNPDALRLIVDQLVLLKRDAEAAEYMAQMPAGSSSGVDKVTSLNMGINLYNDNKLPEAVEKFTQVIAANPDFADAYYNRGLAYIGQGMNAEALADFEKVLELDPNYPNAELCNDFIKELSKNK